MGHARGGDVTGRIRENLYDRKLLQQKLGHLQVRTGQQGCWLLGCSMLDVAAWYGSQSSCEACSAAAVVPAINASLSSRCCLGCKVCCLMMQQQQSSSNSRAYGMHQALPAQPSHADSCLPACLQSMRNQANVREMMFALRTDLLRNIANVAKR
jgi:hypothetical protein